MHCQSTEASKRSMAPPHVLHGELHRVCLRPTVLEPLRIALFLICDKNSLHSRPWAEQNIRFACRALGATRPACEIRR